MENDDILVTYEEYCKFMEAIEREAKPNDGLKELMESKDPWGEDNETT